MTRMLRTFALIFLAASLAGCDSESPGADAGGNDGGTDSQVETVAPTVIGTLPRDGATEVDPSTSIRITFSEAIDPASGSIAMSADDSELEVSAPSASEDGRELTFTLSSPLPTNAAIEVVIAGYRDLAGNAMAGEHSFSFTTSDPVPPTVVSATPAEGAADVAPEIEILELEFSERMNAALGVAELEGGPGSIGLPVWDGARATFSLAGLAANSPYRVVLRGFADPAGNALDGAIYLGDGALDFTTGDDRTPPVVVESTPREGQEALPPSPTTRVRVVFNEPMDTSAGIAKLEDGSSSTELVASWTGGDRILLLDVMGMLEVDRSYRVTLTGFTDRAGNALDGAAYLGDGALDFATGDDEPAPFVLFSDPLEMSSGTVWSRERLFLTFSEEMDTSTTSIPYTDGVRSGSFAATWSSGGALLEIDVAGELISGRDYVLDLTALSDQDGIPLDAEHAYLGDGKLNFRTATPKGENCQDFLTNAQATVADGVYTWTIDGSQVANADGAAPCDPSGGSADAVVRYTKTSPDSTDASGAGRVLRVTVTSQSTLSNKTLNVDVLRDACDPTSSVVERLYCATGQNPQTFDLDVPPGEYFVWVAASTTAFGGATIEIEEIPAGQGDTCRNAIPLTPGTTNSVRASGEQSLHAPSCTGDAALTWYRFTARESLTILRANAPSIAAVVAPGTGDEARCGDDAQTEGVAVFAEAGTEICVALSSNEFITSISLEQEIPYTGVRGMQTVIPVTKPSGTPSLSTLGWLAVQGDFLYRGQSSPMRVSTSGGALSAAPFPTGFSRYGGSAVTRPEGLYVTTDSVAPTGSRIWRVTDAAGELLPEPVEIDVLPDDFEYPNRRFDALAFDGTHFLTATAQSTTLGSNPDCCVPVTFWAIPAAGGAPVQLGSNDFIDDVSALAADATYVYVYGRSGSDEAVWRLRRDQLDDPDQLPVELMGGLELSNDNGSLYIDSTTNPGALYFRTYARTSGGNRHGSDVWVVVEPDEASPAWVGRLWTASGTKTDNGLAYDPAGPTLWVLDTTSPNSTVGRWIRLD